MEEGLRVGWEVLAGLLAGEGITPFLGGEFKGKVGVIIGPFKPD